MGGNVSSGNPSFLLAASRLLGCEGNGTDKGVDQFKSDLQGGKGKEESQSIMTGLFEQNGVADPAKAQAAGSNNNGQIDTQFEADQFRISVFHGYRSNFNASDPKAQQYNARIEKSFTNIMQASGGFCPDVQQAIEQMFETGQMPDAMVFDRKSEGQGKSSIKSTGANAWEKGIAKERMTDAPIQGGSAATA